MRDHIRSCKLQDTQRVTVLDRGVVGVEVLEECQESVVGNTWEINLEESPLGRRGGWPFFYILLCLDY